MSDDTQTSAAEQKVIGLMAKLAANAEAVKAERTADKPPPGYRPGFVTGAAPQAIEWRIKHARRRLRAAERELGWLEDLLAERKAQIVAGTWPPRVVGEVSDGSA